MRLLEYRDEQLKLTKDLHQEIPRYAILSHTWGPDNEEVTFQDLMNGTGEDKDGYRKILFCVEKAKLDGLQYFRVDTCCIDKSNNNELSTAINSMFRWYQNSARCYVYLSNMLSTAYGTDQQSEPAWGPEFRAHKWFTRGWTLQELLAPSSVEFFTEDGRRVGDKKSLERIIHEITGIGISALREGNLSVFSVDERFRWAEGRHTTQEEAWAYSLLGIFNIFMPLIYGEGKAHAIRRLKKEVADATNRNDQLKDRGVENATWIVPFERNSAFTGREAELERLRGLINKGHHTAKVAITGLGGVGKTQLALELIHRIRSEYDDCSVIWIPATTREALEQAYLKVARQLDILGCNDDEANVKKLVQNYLSREKAGWWILVFDNADDIGLWVEESGPRSDRLIDSLPRSSSGSIIFTTRSRKAAVQLAGRNLIEMSEMDESVGLQLLRNSLVDQDIVLQDEASSLLTWLTYLPLAIVQAAIYINTNGLSLKDYLFLLKEQEEDVIELLSEDFEDEGRYRDLVNPVATTWLISFEQIRQRDPLAADYLSFMACVDAKSISQSILPPGLSRKRETDAIGTLLGYSFIAKRPTDSTITIHRLVHLATRNWLRKEGLLSIWTGRAISRLYELLASVNRDDRVIWRSYLPHTYYLLQSIPDEDNSEIWISLVNAYAQFLYDDGRFWDIEPFAKRALDLCILKLGDTHSGTLIQMNNLALSYRFQGRLKDSELLFTRAIEICKNTGRANASFALTIMNNLMDTYEEQGRWQDAEELGIGVMETLTSKHGPSDLAVLSTMGHLASAIRHQGRFAEAEQLNLRILQIRKSKLGDNHTDTMLTMNCLSVIYLDQGRYKEAEELLLQTVHGRKLKLGVDHPETLISMSNLAAALSGQELWQESRSMLEEVLTAQKLKLRPDHPGLLNTMNNLAGTFTKLKLSEEAENMHTKVFEVRKETLGPHHPETLMSMNNVATAYLNQGRPEDASELLEEQFKNSVRVLGQKHPRTLVSMCNLAILRKVMGKDDALDLVESCYNFRQEVLGPDHPKTLETLSILEEWREDTN